ncbi:hypothetical protein BCR37DRAFT_318629 [Protomyces lactucae-debilis]|uniref:Uncharacterized protein n=1 Tax=Protomyces lactucae-debilis TaxID=2754530 RepID=A0A1Y2FFE5_PROLT|nr:uncharacterized protein BCR37DRAFT_318629 [Protomyces lactucae-debilis]ORY82668.1 hypothetical protein BCR37DRAFT_318629 [Protomyces lactucae-debilis]
MTVEQGRFRYPYIKVIDAPKGFKSTALKELVNYRGAIQRTSPTTTEILIECKLDEEEKILKSLTTLLIKSKTTMMEGDGIQSLPSAVFMDWMP